MTSFPATHESSLLSAARWLEGLLHSQAVTVLAIMAVAGIGFSLMAGRMPVRRGVSVVLGCFLLFGASTIARGLMSVVGDPGGQAPLIVELPPTPPPAEAPTPRQNVVVDPYAGATVAG